MKIIGTATKFLSRNSATIMIGLGIAGYTSSVILASKAASKAKDILDRKKIESNKPKLNKKETIKTVWKLYIPATVVFTLSTVCVIASYRVNYARNAVLASTLTASEASMERYQRHVIEEFGEDAESKIRKKVAEEEVVEKSPVKYEIVAPDNAYEVNCYEASTHQRFHMSKEDIRRVINDLNQDRLTSIGGSVTLNDFYDALGLEHTSVGDCLGWTVDRPVMVDFSAIESNGIPCLYVKPQNWTSLMEV